VVEKGKQSFKSNVVIVAIKNISAIMFPLVTFPYVSRILGLNNLGKYSFSNSIVGYFVLFASLGISYYAIREGSGLRLSRDKLSKFADQIFSINIFSTVISYVILFILIFTVPILSDYTILILIMSIQIVSSALGLEWIYSIYEDYLYITVRSIIFQIISLILVFIYIKDSYDLEAYALLSVFSIIASNIINFISVRKYYKPKLTYKIDWKKHLKPIIILFAMTLTISIYVSSDKIMLGFISGDSSVGLYAVSTKIYSIIKIFISSVIIVSIPRLAFYYENNELRLFEKTAKKTYSALLTITIPTVIGIIMLRKEFILILSGENYIDATSSLLILSLALVLTVSAYFWGQCILVPIKKEMIVFKITLISAIINVILNFFLIPLWDEKAAAFTTFISEGIAFIYLSYIGRKNFSLNGLLAIILKILIGCTGIVLTITSINFFVTNIFIRTFMSVFISILVYFSIQTLLKNESVIDILNSLKKKIILK
jgi:O-antigen/teichoic acid export membrane protein